MSNDTQPEIRFPGFTEDWEQRELSDISTKVQTKNKDREFTETLTNSAEFGIISQNDFFDKEISNKNNIDGYYVVKPNDFVYNPRISNFAPVGPIKRNKLGRTGVMSPLYYVFSTNNIDNQYLETYFSTSYWHKFMKLNGDSGARADRFAIRDSVFVKMPIPYPSREEQEKIGQFFEVLSNAIDLQQRKLDLLKETKKGFLQKMFPKNGAKVPEIRFPGFTEDWEQRKAKELFIPKAEKNQPELPVLSVTQDHGVVYREQVGIDIKYDKATLKNYKVIHQGDFVISLRSFQGGFELSDKLGITSPAYTIFVPKNMDSQDNLFWKTKFKTFTFIESLKTVTFGIRDGKSISFSEFGDLKLFFPKNIEEQQKIGNFFKQLDDTITLHQRKLDLLKETKKGFLQKMFV